MLSTLAMFVTGVAVLIVGAAAADGRRRCRSTRSVLAHDMRYFAIAYALAIGAAFLPLEPVWLKWIVAVVLIGIYAWYVKGHFEADPDVDADGPRAAALPPARPARRTAPTRRVPRLRIVNLQVLAALGLIVLGAFFFVDAVEHLATDARRRRGAARAGHRADRDRAAREVQLGHLGPAGKDTLAMGNITGAMVFQSTIPTVVALVFASSTWQITHRAATSRSPRPGSRSSPSAAIFIPMARSGHLRGRNLLVGGAFYAGVPGPRPRAIAGSPGR